MTPKPKPKKTTQSPHVDTWCFELKAMEIKYECEHKFDSERKFKFDIAIPQLKVGIEYEGIYNATGGKSRHTTGYGYSKDCEKYNLATVSGWKVLRYTATNYRNMIHDVYKILKDNETDN